MDARQSAIWQKWLTRVLARMKVHLGDHNRLLTEFIAYDHRKHRIQLSGDDLLGFHNIVQSIQENDSKNALLTNLSQAIPKGGNPGSQTMPNL